MMQEQRETTVTEQVSTTTPHAVAKEAGANKANQIVWFIFGIINTLIGIRIVFLLLDAREVGFTSFHYSITNPFVAPFRGIFPAPSVDGSYFDTAAFVAAIIFTLLAWGITALIDVARRPAHPQA